MKTHTKLKAFFSQILFNFKDPKTTQTGLNLKKKKKARGGEDIILEWSRVISDAGGRGKASLQPDLQQEAVS